MNRYGRGGSKATTTTLCQKCLKRGHYSYECKSAAQERPYASRPSRTQQFKNPKLAPKLTNTALDEDLLSKRGAAPNQQLEKSHQAKRRIPSVDHMDGLQQSRKHSRSRSRSHSVSSYSSVSTISTRSSRSPSTSQRARNYDHDGGREKRRRRASSSAHRVQLEKSAAHTRAQEERNTRPRRSSTSPAERGRRRSRSLSSDQRQRRSSPLEPEERTAYRRKVPHEGLSSAGGRYPTHDSHDREMSDPHTTDRTASQDPTTSRQCSLSPYSKRVSLMQDSR